MQKGSSETQGLSGTRDEEVQVWDCTLLTDTGGHVRCSKKDLAMHSHFFRAMFRPDWYKAESGEVVVKQVSTTALQAIVGYLFTTQACPKAIHTWHRWEVRSLVWT